MQIAKTHTGSINKGHVIGITNYQKIRNLRKEQTETAYNDYIIDNMMMLNRHSFMPQMLVNQYAR